MDALKIAALDADDLQVLSAQVQDAVCPFGNLAFDRGRGLFTVTLNRLADDGRERRLSVLSFARVSNVRFSGIRQDETGRVVALLAIVAEAVETGVQIDLVFAGNVTVRLAAECIEARLADTGAAWRAGMAPRHGV